ncbi:hypothetical protein NKR23_g633 [Pleurostoma richardsiae]|uniref:Dolichyl-diphosphooligosaccharide--protein glycosyltransferase subunit OST2 n=1 Tax=Pleurostoma richardsiae TaxID=41990 RepID=A0AA38S1X2_9PEZI|nr:hypothetical protein NKR23_g633 [Pleurostoma richardsiae]
MAPKRAAAREATPSAATTVPGTPAPVTATTPSKTGRTALNDKSTIFQIVESVWHHYIDTTPQRTFLIDAFLGFLVVLGIVQFLYCILAGNYPFNAFLSGFSATVGQFVLTASLRMQTTEENKADFPFSPERAFADYIVCSLILHFFCVNFIN